MTIKSEAEATNPKSHTDWVIPFQELIARRRGRELIVGLALVILMAALGIAITMQGWRSRTPAHDLVPHIYNVRNFLEHGTIPVHGDTGSYGSYKPPGTAWLMLPSTLLFDDPRLSEYVGTAILHSATLLGIFLLAYRYFGFWSASLAVLIYGLSSTGLFLAGSLWPNGRPDFYVWITYFASQWTIRRDARYLAVAVTIWGVGMNVDMAILPAAFIFPTLWLVYRPPVRLKPLVLAIGLVMLMWSPYLHFEATRGFADIRSQVFFQNIFPETYRTTWCVPDIPLRDAGTTSTVLPINSTEPQPYKGPNLWSAASTLAHDIRAKLSYNFQDAASAPAVSAIFLLMVLSSLILLSVRGSTPVTNTSIELKSVGRDRTTRFALALILIGILTNEFVITHLFGIQDALDLSKIRSLRTIEKLLILGGASILASKWITTFVDWLLTKISISIPTREHASQVKVLILSLAIPWFILLLVAEPGKPERFWWLWPLQSIFLASFIFWILPRLRIPHSFIWIISISVIAMVSWNSFLLSRISDWRQHGWAGMDAAEVQVVNFLSAELKAAGKDKAAIGYHFFIYQFMAAYNIMNPQYKVGNDFDLLLKYPHEITNTNRCAEGLSPADEYRILQTTPRPEAWAPRMYFDAPLDPSFKFLSQFGRYQVFKRQ